MTLMLLLLTIGMSIIAKGQAATAQDLIEIDNGDCGSLPNGKQWPTAPAGPPALKQRDSTSAHEDLSTASSFEIWRDYEAGGHAQLYVCYADIHLEPSKAASGLHLLITLPKELPKGTTVGDFVKQLDVTGSDAKIYIKVPRKLHARVLLKVPEQTNFEIGLGRGSVDFTGILGDKQIGVGFGTATVHMRPNEYSQISSGIALGGVKDERLGGKNHGHLTSGFEEKGEGKYKLEVGMAWGHLILLPEK